MQRLTAEGRQPTTLATDDGHDRSYRLYPWQEEALAAAKSRNTIVMIPTNGGKTLVAIKAIDHYAKLQPSKKALFVVPTTILVQQQAGECERKCEPRKSCARLHGSVMDSWTQRQWDQCLQTYDILVGTPAVFEKAFVTSAFLSMSRFHLLVFDECHAAVGNSPLVGIMQALTKLEASQRPAVLGLTGSFNNGAMNQVDAKKLRLEQTLTAQMCCPDMTLFVTKQNKTWTKIGYVSDITPEGTEIIRKHTDSVLAPWAAKLRDPKERSRLLAAAEAVYENFGVAGWAYFLREGIVAQLIAKNESAAEYGGGPILRPLDLKQFKSYLASCVDKLGPELTRLPYVSSKFRRLLSLLIDKQRELSELRVLIFVERVMSTNPLVDLLNRDFASHSELQKCCAAPVCGTGAMSDTDREDRMLKFRKGELNVLVCTASLEEGIDVPECNLVVRYDEFKTTKQHIQGSGRARCQNAQIFYFENDTDRAIAAHSHMESVARNEQIHVTSEQIEQNLQNKPKCPFHPYQHKSSGALLDIFNAINVVYEYIQKTMGSFDPDSLWSIHPKTLAVERLRYPSPKGLLTINIADVTRVWGSTQVSDIVDSEQIKRWTSLETEKRRFLFVAALDLVNKGYLDQRNNPTAICMQENRRVCPAYDSNPGFRFRNDYKNTTPTPDHRAEPSATFHFPINTLTALSQSTASVAPLSTSSNAAARANTAAASEELHQHLSRLTLLPHRPAHGSSSFDPETVKRKVLDMLSARGPVLLTNFVQDYESHYGGKEDLDAALVVLRLGTFLFNSCGCSRVGAHHVGLPNNTGIQDKNNASLSAASLGNLGGSIGGSGGFQAGDYRVSSNNNNNVGDGGKSVQSGWQIGDDDMNYKGMLQEKLQKMFRAEHPKPQYTSHESGTCQAPAFEVRLTLSREMVFWGHGRTKKAAEQMAAKTALAALNPR